jgi:hypothetical protein
MRDDIHKSVLRPAKVQQWVKCSLREADRVTGRSVEALAVAMDDACKREISAGFLNGIKAHLQGLPDLFGPLDGVAHPRDVGGTGGQLEVDMLSCVQRRVAEGQPLRDATTQGFSEALSARNDADIRAAEPVLLGSDDPRARSGIGQMRKDAASIDYLGHAESLLELQPGPNINGPAHRLSADEDLLGGAFRNGGG